MALGWRDLMNHAHHHGLHRSQHHAQQDRTGAHAPGAGHEGVGDEQGAGGNHGAQHHLRFGHMARDDGHQQADHGRCNRKSPQDAADHRGRQSAFMTQNGNDKGMHVPARGKRPVQQQQAPEAPVLHQIPGRCLLVRTLGLQCGQLLHRSRPEPGRQRHQGQQQEGGPEACGTGRFTACVVDQQPGRKRPQKVGNGRANRQPAEDLAQLVLVVRHAPHMALQGDQCHAGCTARQQRAQAQHRIKREQHSHSCSGTCGRHTDDERTLEPVTIRIAPRRQRQKHLGQCKQCQQHADRGRAVPLLERQQRRGHAHSGHGAMNTDLREDQAQQGRIHSSSSLAV